MMKKLVALLMALAMLCSSIAAFAEVVPNDAPSAEPGREGEDAYGYISTEDPNEYKNHVGHNVQKSGTAGPEADVAPTCTTAGKTWSVCKNDDCKVRFWQPENALEHDYQPVEEGSYAPTYEAEGNQHYECSRCDAEKDEPIPSLATYGPLDGFDRYMETPKDEVHKHGWCKDEANKEPTCEEDGYYYLLCADCGQYYKYVGDKTATNHDFDGKEAVFHGIDPKRTCTEDGLMHYSNYCIVCKQTIEWTETLPALGHTYRDENGQLKEDGVVIQKADCTHNEIRRFTCTRCNEYEDIEMKETALGHSWEEEGTEHTHVIKQVTCAEDGSYGMAKICDRCGEADPDSITTVEAIKALDHTKEWKESKKLGGYLDEDGNYIGTDITIGNKTIHLNYLPDVEKLKKDLYKELKALGVVLKPFNATTVEEVRDAIIAQEIPADVLIKVLDNVTVDMYPVLTYTYPSVDEETGTVTNKELDLSRVDTIPEYEIDVKIQVGDGSEGSENPLQDVIVKGLIHETKVTYNRPTCTATGSIVLTCTECDDEYVIELPKLEHAYIPIRGVRRINDLEGDLIKDCTQANSILQKCIFCGHRYNQAIEPAKKHTIELPEYEDGELYGRCMIVGFVQQKEWDDAPVTYYLNGTSLDDIDITMGQFYGYGFDGDERLYWTKLQNAFSKIATCRDFDVIVKCAVPFCQHTEKIHVAAYTDHVANGYIIDKDPTCTEEGVHTFNCKYCGEFHTDYDEPTGHTPVNGKTLEEPKCEETGLREIICDVCKEVLVEKETIPALGHHWIEKDDPANCAEKKIGLKYEYCPNCGKTRNLQPYEGHKIGTVIDEVKATCTKGGTIYGVCEICHRDVEVPTQKLGHTYDDKDYVHECYTKDAPTPKGHYCEKATCKPGAEHGNICWHVCTRCGDEKMVDDGTVVEHDMYKIDEEGQRVLNRFVIKELPACDKTGKAEYVCSRCEYHEKNYELPALPHNYQIEFDQATGAYNLVCTKMDNTELGLTNLYNKMIETSYKDNEQVADAIVDMLSKSTGEKIKGTGCGDVKPFEIRKTEYVVTKISDKKGQVELVEGALEAKDPVYVRLAWNYSQSNGDTICFVTIAEIEWNDEEEKVLGTFRCSGLQMPDGWDCNFCRVDVVTDPDADDLFPGQYKDYGYDYI